jgi:hypothetical protein
MLHCFVSMVYEREERTINLPKKYWLEAEMRGKAQGMSMNVVIEQALLLYFDLNLMPRAIEKMGNQRYPTSQESGQLLLNGRAERKSSRDLGN